MSQEEILIRAKQGDQSAIAFIINQALNNIGVKARADIQKNNLHLSLEASELPDKGTCLKHIHQRMKALEVPSIDFVNIYGLRLGHTIPEWTEVIELHQPRIYHPAGVGTIWWQLENIDYSQECSTLTLPCLTKSNFTKTETIFSSHDIERKSSNKNNKFTWLLVSVISIVLVPISTAFVNSQTYRLNTIISNIFPPPKISPPNTSVAEVSQPVSATLSSPKNIQNLANTPNKNQFNLSEASEFILSSIKSPINPETRITIKAVGDIIPGTNYPKNKLHPRKQELFVSVKKLLQNADIVFGNFESTLTSYPKSRKIMGSGRVFAFRTPPDYRHLLKDAGFNVLSVANNHSFDFFKQGFEDTIANIKTVGMQAVGKKGEIVYRKVKGINIGFIAFSNYSYHNSLLDLDSAKKLVQEADKNADIVVISVHAGAEGTRALRIKNRTEYFFGENRGNKVLFAHKLIDEGADLILGHGPHVPRAMEIYQGKLIAYSLGNFMGYRTLSSKGKLGYSFVLELDVNPRGDFVFGKILPVHLNSKGIPYPDKLGRSIKLIKELTQKDFPKTMLEINSKGEITKKKG